MWTIWDDTTEGGEVMKRRVCAVQFICIVLFLYVLFG